MAKPETKTVPHFIILTEVDTNRRIAINANTIHSFYEHSTDNLGEPPITYIHLTNDIAYIVTETPATVLMLIYNTELDGGEDNDH